MTKLKMYVGTAIVALATVSNCSQLSSPKPKVRKDLVRQVYDMAIKEGERNQAGSLRGGFPVLYNSIIYGVVGEETQQGIRLLEVLGNNLNKNGPYSTIYFADVLLDGTIDGYKIIGVDGTPIKLTNVELNQYFESTLESIIHSRKENKQ